MKKHLTRAQRVHNAVGIQKAEEYKGAHAYLHAVALCREEFDVFWHKSDNTTWAHQFGRMVGWDEIYYDGVVFTEMNMSMMKASMMKQYKELWGHDMRTSTGSGAHALTSDVIEAADDGMSIRMYYQTPGTLMGSIGFIPGHRGGTWLWERYGSEFIFVDGEWKWFHEHVCPDMVGDYDIGNWAHDRFEQFKDGTLRRGELGGYPYSLTEPGTLHWDYSINQVIQDTVPPPKPYKTLDDDNTYSPGRTDPTGKSTVKTDGPRVIDWRMPPMGPGGSGGGNDRPPYVDPDMPPWVSPIDPPAPPEGFDGQPPDGPGGPPPEPPK
jgi:hypothetical protein